MCTIYETQGKNNYFAWGSGQSGLVLGKTSVNIISDMFIL